MHDISRTRPCVPQRRRAARTSGCALVLALTLAGCGDPLVAPQLITNVRVLAERTEAQSPEAAWPTPGSAAKVRWFVVSPEGAPALGWATWMCRALPISRGLPLCASANFASMSHAPDTATARDFEFTAPDPAELNGAETINAFAAFCASGAPALEELSDKTTQAQCPDSAETPLLATASIPIAVKSAANLNPSFASVEIRMDDEPWPAWSEPSDAVADCANAGAAVPALQAGTGGHRIALDVPTVMSEALSMRSSHSASREELTLSHFVTAGHLERAFSSVSLGAETATTLVHWDAPSSVEPTGSLVRFHFVIRDGRGGADWTTRAACIFP